MVLDIKKGESAPKDGHLLNDKEWATVQKVLNYVVMDKVAHNRIKNITISKVSSSEVKV